MSWPRFEKTMLEGTLDRETKMMLIDLLSGTSDKKIEEEIFSLVFAYESANAETQKLLETEIKKAIEEYEKTKSKMQQAVRIDELAIADELQKQEKLQNIKKYLETL